MAGSLTASFGRGLQASRPVLPLRQYTDHKRASKVAALILHRRLGVGDI